MPAKIDCVVRIDSKPKRTHGWQGRVFWNGFPYSRLFSDLKHGGKRKAYHRALAWVLQTERALGKPHSTRYVYGRSKKFRRAQRALLNRKG